MALPILRTRPVNRKRVETKKRQKEQDFWKSCSFFTTPEKLTSEQKFRETALKLITSNPELKDYQIEAYDRVYDRSGKYDFLKKHKNISDSFPSDTIHLLGHYIGESPLDSIIIDKKHNCVFFKKIKRIVSIDFLKDTLSKPLDYLVESWDSYAGPTGLYRNHKEGAKVIFKLMKELDVKINNKYHEKNFLEENDKDLNILFDHFTLPQLIQMGTSRKLLAYRYSSKDLMQVRTKSLKRT